MRVRSLGFRTDLALRVLEGATISDRGAYLVIRSPDNPDYWWGNFLLIRDAPETGGPWLGRFAEEFPAARHIAIGVDITEDLAAEPEEFRTAGLELERATVLTAAALRPPPHPNTDAEIRLLGSDADWRQSVELAVRCFDGGEPGDYLERRTAARRRLIRPEPGPGSAPSTAGAWSRSWGCSTRATGTPVISTWRPTRPRAAGAWPARWSGTRAGTAARSCVPGPWSSWPTRRTPPSGSTAAAA